jgi:Ring finger domain
MVYIRMADDYVSVYGVGLLDDIHNYFPALLYDTGRFQNMANVFSYVRNQLDTRFNLFRHGASLYASTHQTPFTQSRQTTNVPPPTVPFSYVSPTPLPYASATGLPTATSLPRATRNANDVAAANLLLGFLRMSTEDDLSNYIQIPARTATATAGNAWTDPIIVRPTAQAIAAGTEPVLGSSLAENTGCAICQDTIIPTDPARRLVACGHVYHRGCIDEWFRRSVYCPSCRHDIRLPSVNASASAASQQQQQPVTTPLPRSPREDEVGSSYFS